MKYPLVIVLLAGLLYSCAQHESRTPHLPFDEEKPQTFSVNPSNDTLIIGHKGTRIKFRKNGFIDSLGQQISEPVTIVLKEFYTIEDFINNRLSTRTTDGRLLSSSGMIYLEATSGNKTLQIKESAPATLMFPRIIKSSVANLFSGQRGKHDEIEWHQLQPVHVDTTLFVRDVVVGASELARVDDDGFVKIEVYAVIGPDTTQLTETNRTAFENVLRRRTGLSYTAYKAKLAKDRTARLEMFEKFNYYVFQTNQLGFINCDIFIKEELYPFSVQSTEATEIVIIVDSLNSVIYPDAISRTSSDDEIHMSVQFKLPDDKAVTVVSYKIDKTNGYRFDMTRSNTSKKQVTVKLQPTTLEEMKLAIKSLAKK